MSFGLIAGTGLTRNFENNAYDPVIEYDDMIIDSLKPKRLIVGGMLEARLPLHLSVELDGLYRELGYVVNMTTYSGTPLPSAFVRVNTWEFPLLAKYRFSVPLVKPFVEAGPTFRESSNLSNTTPSNHGFAAGIGVEAHVWKIKIAPQFRYLRWAHDPRSVPLFTPFAKQDQAELLVSVSY